MKKIVIFALFIVCFVFVQSQNRNAVRRYGSCSWVMYENSTCSQMGYLCLNGKCIDRKQYCDDRNDCGDNSDERFCNTITCGFHVAMKACPGTNKCIPQAWFCDGIVDCSNKRDEEFCDQSNRTAVSVIAKTVEWLNRQKKNQSSTEMWGSIADRTAIAFYLAGNFSKNITKDRKDLAYEVSIQVLSQISKGELKDIPSTDLAMHLNALLVTCLNPRKFQGLDIVGELRTRVDKETFTNPYVLISLCNAGDTITKADVDKLMAAWDRKNREFWTDMQAGILMALACASRQPGSTVDAGALKEKALDLKLYQSRNGTVENLQTTALVLQALLAADPVSDPDNFDDSKALQQMISMQKEDGSFGTFMNTYYVLPVLNCMSLVNVSSALCPPIPKDDKSGLDELIDLKGPKVRVEYSIWIGDEKDLERNLALRVPASLSFYGVMEIAATVDSNYKFDYIVRNRKPYVSALSGLQNDPEMGKFWFLYTVVDGKPVVSAQMPADAKIKENDHFVMWYRSGTWTE